VFGRLQLSLGVGRVIDDQLDSDKLDIHLSGLRYQTGISGGIFYSLNEFIAIGVDYFHFKTDWWGAPNSTTDDTAAEVRLPGRLPAEKQVMHFINAGATFHW
jgi:hypothetical protein